MNCLSVKPPWGELMFWPHDPKDVENRSWRTEHRGPLLIHSSKTLDQEALDLFAPKRPGLNIVKGAIIGKVDVVNCTRQKTSKWHALGSWGWYLKNPVRFRKPVPYRGRLKLFEVDLDTLIPKKAAWMWMVDFMGGKKND